MIKIGKVVETLSISADTLRYYEKIALMPKVHRNNNGVRFYSDKDLSRLRFIKRAQKMGFSLEEIANLLRFRENPQNAKPQVRELAHQKLTEIEEHLTELSTLRDELQLLTNLCGANPDSCPILDEIDKG
ncbi:heavy metal-responsive transcriptional regulator [Marinobacter sp. NP-4(2019)]|uniref:heavy metal-responsive transcriptional regulator n=1 Tax=Marinobacter sp. NP-4(2019) TaxID=2488665 RepID=UPI000FC3CCF0|nr:heavy metal-responsive transcriptional regulator [Marinobacter sp. NP-4(2019)]AZT82218.1 heavy metal-responsive transcriptional regulator [Marinobacter sp. NP-4(2019)]